MKMKFTLLAAAAMLGMSASAQHYVSIADGFATDFSRLLTPGNSTTATSATKMPGIVVTGSTDSKTVLIQGETFNDNIYGAYGPDGETIGVYVAEGTTQLKFRYNTNNKNRQNGTDFLIPGINRKSAKEYTEAYVKFMVGPKPENATTDVVTPRIELAGTSAGVTTISFAPITLTDEAQEFVIESTGVTPSETALNNLGYVDFFLDGVSEGQFVSYQCCGLADVRYAKVGFDTQTTRSLGFWGAQEVLPGTIFIQAEDFDDVRADGTPAHSATALGFGQAWTDGYGYPNAPQNGGYWTKGDLSMIRLDAAQNNCGGMGVWQQYADGFSSQNAGLGFAICGMSKRDGDWGTLYGGEYLDETSNKISLDQAMEGFGAWFEYTFEMEEDGYVDISVGATAHHSAWFTEVLTGGSRAQGGAYVTKYQKPREEGGYEVEGLDDDFLKLYGFTYVLSMDGDDLLTNWPSRPLPSTFNGAIADSKWTNPFEWDDNYEIDGEGNQVNSKFLLVTPPYGCWDNGTLWWPLYKNEVLRNIYNTEDTPFRAQCLAEGDDYFEKTYNDRPDYADVPCSAGKHTIRVRSMGGTTVFDELRIRAHANKEHEVSGIEGVKRNIIETGADAPAEYFDLQGRKVANPSNGIFIVKRGDVVTKEVVK